LLLWADARLMIVPGTSSTTTTEGEGLVSIGWRWGGTSQIAATAKATATADKPVPTIVAAETSTQKASAAFQRGQAADDNNDWATAIAHYEASYAASPHPNTAFNLAVDYERVGRKSDAIHYFRVYLATEVNAKDATAVEDRIRRLQKTK
jgi:tetratricopeptide (TPR) repeat protein